MRLLLALIVAALLTTLAAPADAQTRLRVFAGGANQRPDLMRLLFAEYSKLHPGVSIETESGGGTSDLQRQYLSTVLNARDPSIDIYLIDIVNPAQYFGAGWLEPLNAYLGAPAQVMKDFLPAYAHRLAQDLGRTGRGGAEGSRCRGRRHTAGLVYTRCARGRRRLHLLAALLEPGP